MFQNFFRFLSILLLVPALLFAQNPPVPDIASLIQRIEARRGTWIGMRADVALEFTAAKDRKAECKGKLLYHRLDERILLSCFDEKDQPVFYFKTDDSTFQLYLIAHKTLYQGSIFDLEASPQIQSHLRALDLYRSLKPGILTPAETSLKSGMEKNTVLVISRNGKKVRELEVTAEGDALEESYFDGEEKLSSKIERGEWDEIKGTKPQAVFPRRILISSSRGNSSEELNQTSIAVEGAQFLPNIETAEFTIPLPQNIRKVVL
jgi:hypothetical protein